MTTGRDSRDFQHVTVSSLSPLMFSVTNEVFFSWVTDVALTCSIFFWHEHAAASTHVELRWLELQLYWYVWSKHLSDIVSGSCVVWSVHTFATVRSNVNLENWTLVKSLAYSSCEVKEGQRIVLYVGFQLTLTQDIVPDDICTHYMSTVTTRLYSIVESRHQFHPLDEFLMSSCFRLTL